MDIVARFETRPIQSIEILFKSLSKRLMGKPEGFFSGHDDDTRQYLHSVLDLAMDFVSGSLRKGRVINYKTPREFLNEFHDSVPEVGISKNDLLTILRRVGEFSISQSDVNYIAFPDTANAIPGLAGDIFSKFLNQNLIAVDRSAPYATFIEMQVIEWLRELVGYETKPLGTFSSLDEVGGMWTTGGHMSNHIAIMTALNERFPLAKTKGLTALSLAPKIVLADKISHYSYSSAMHHLGLGQDNIISCNSNSDYTTDFSDLEKILCDHKSTGDIFMVVAVAGNSRTSSLDNINRIADLCEKYGVWLHVDACHGGSLLFSDQLKRRDLAGIDRAQSVALDPHKGMFVTYASSYILFRERGELTRYSRYESKIKDGSAWDLGYITPFYGSKPFESLKVWLLLKYFGKKRLGEIVEQRDHHAQFIWETLNGSGYFAMFNDRTFYRMCFVYLPREIQDLLAQKTISEAQKKSLRHLIDEYTHAINQKLYEQGRVCLDEFKLHDIGNVTLLGAGEEKFFVMSVTIGNPLYTKKQLQETLATVFLECEKAKQSFIEKAKSTIEMETLRNPSAFQLSGPAGWQ